VPLVGSIREVFRGFMLSYPVSWPNTSRAVPILSDTHCKREVGGMSEEFSSAEIPQTHHEADVAAMVIMTFLYV
jgi:hypothetical protein